MSNNSWTVEDYEVSPGVYNIMFSYKILLLPVAGIFDNYLLFTADKDILSLKDVDYTSSTITSKDITKTSNVYGSGSSTTIIISTETYSCVFHNTQILTPKGYVKIKDLEIGDKILTGNGRVSKILHKVVIKHPKPLNEGHPILIKRNSLGPNLPWKDLYLTKCHKVMVKNYMMEAFILTKYPIHKDRIVDTAGKWIKPVHYQHLTLETPKDTFVANGIIVEQCYNNKIS